MQKGDFIEISYTGKIKENGSIFDKGDVIIALGRNMILPPLEKYLLEMNVGERKNVNVSPEEAFGKRNENLIKTIPLSEFKKHNTNPYPGMIISADNMQGRVLSINGGRVTVDFNHPLAGKYLNYDIEIKRKIEDKEEKIRAILEYFSKSKLGKIEIKEIDKKIEIIVPPILNPLVKKLVSNEIFEIFDFDEVKFSEVFERKK